MVTELNYNKDDGLQKPIGKAEGGEIPFSLSEYFHMATAREVLLNASSQQGVGYDIEKTESEYPALKSD